MTGVEGALEQVRAAGFPRSCVVPSDATMKPMLTPADYQTLLSILAKVPMPTGGEGEDWGCYVIGDGPEAAIVGDEGAYLSLVRTLIGVLFEAKQGLAEGEFEVSPIQEGGWISNIIGGEINDWHGHLNLVAMYVAQDRTQMDQIGQRLGWYREKPSS